MSHRHTALTRPTRPFRTRNPVASDTIHPDGDAMGHKHPSEEDPPLLTRIFWGTKLALVFVVLVVGTAKVFGDPNVRDIFTALDHGDWWRVAVGVLEISAAILLMLPKFTRLGAALLGGIMCAFIGAHLATSQGQPVPAAILLGLIAWITVMEKRH